MSFSPRNPPETSTESEALAAQARAFLQHGNLPQAQASYVKLLRLVPEHAEALGFLGIQALNAGQAARAIELFQQALHSSPDDATLYKNLGLALRLRGSLPESLTAFHQALQIKPDFLVAALNQGAVLEQLGRPAEALPVYLRALQQADAEGLSLRAETLPAGLRQLLSRAREVARTAREQWVRNALAPVQARYGTEALTRVEHCLAVHFDHLPAPAPHPLQRPTFMSFPDIPARAWFERGEFPWLAQIERQTEAIREELVEVLRSDAGFRPFVEIPRDHPGARYWEAVNHSPSWNAFFFYRDGVRHEENCRRCPVTAAALDATPISRVAEHSPEAFFSVLKPGTHIPPHTGVINTRLVAHLPLIIPENCGIRVGNETRGWKEGECIVFDDTFEHEAWNKSGRTRVVLIFDIWNPYLSEAEQQAMKTVVEEMGRFYSHHQAGQGGDAAG